MTVYLSRMLLNRSASARSIASLVNPSQDGVQQDAHHKLIWSLFGDATDRQRDFIWRYEGQDRFYTLSQRAPLTNDLFTDFATKSFAPNLKTGDKLSFLLRANATKTARKTEKRPNGNGYKVQRIDLVMDKLRPLPRSERGEKRMDFAKKVATDWMSGKGENAGFVVTDLTLHDYSQIVLPSAKQLRGDRKFGVLDMSGHISITDPDKFFQEYPKGFGRAKAWGCGFMMIRRA